MELKPCPFCGGEVEYHPQEYHIENFWGQNTIFCPECKFQIEDTSAMMLIKRWNRRAEDDKRKT